MSRLDSIIQAINVSAFDKSQVLDVHIFMNDQFAELVASNGVFYGRVVHATLLTLLLKEFKDVHALAVKEDERFVFLSDQSGVEVANSFEFCIWLEHLNPPRHEVAI